MNSRILHVTAVDFTTSRLLRPQLEFLQEQGYDVRVATGRSTDEAWKALAPFTPFDAGFPRSLAPGAMLRASLRLLRYVRRWKPDIVHLHTPAASLPLRLMPLFLWPRGTRILYTVHGYLHPWPPTTMRDRVVQRVEAWESRRTEASLFQSAEDYEQALAHGYASRLVLIGNGVQDDWFGIPSIPKLAGELRLLYIGRIVREKGILDLLEAVAHEPGITLHIAGDALSSDRDGVVAEATELVSTRDLQNRVTFHGMLEMPQLLQLMATVDAVCLPSYREGVPRSVIEGLAAGRPVLATDIRGSRELVKHQVNGYLADAGDVDSLSRGLRWLRDMPSEDFLSMSAAARCSMDPERRESLIFQRISEVYASQAKG